jgi:hypothetical protein
MKAFSRDAGTTKLTISYRLIAAAGGFGSNGVRIRALHTAARIMTVQYRYSLLSPGENKTSNGIL